MKKIYLVKKDPAKEGQDNWIVMNGYEFTRFIETPEGRKRKNNFSVILASDQELNTIVVECSAEKANELKRENQRHEYLRKCRKESGMTVLSTNSPIDDGQITLEAVIPDRMVDIESILIKKWRMEALHAAIGQLSEREHDLLLAFFLTDYPMTEKAYAELHGLSQTHVNQLKKKVLKRLRQYMSDWKN